MSITVDSRTRDPQTRMVVKYETPHGHPLDYKPVRDISPSLESLSPAARFIAERAEGKYIGGMLLRGFLVRVEGPVGSQFQEEVRAHGVVGAQKRAHAFGFDRDERAAVAGWLFPVLEPGDDETEYFEREASRIVSVAGVGGRLIVGGEEFHVA